ncbi:tol-pal system protein YbgF [Rhodoblastus sphagnicola]|uniref:Cell division coordinator CpoB n=1 Tax=Rhodoblastus sphagnicola TaxID=333368 RepID=A0A2S6NBZ8_9HYPH|nr:tol-pal system protein YbgF [Rhodoblastus sphagnicola]MBB4198672.1 tol-pal system protein YbgF [Rhodoblastus sphagnicola]PPQ32138.1 tol-pal system protein YbgF [Rhodoblastus sphagnicola]
MGRFEPRANLRAGWRPVAASIVLALMATTTCAQNYERPPADIEERGSGGADAGESIRVDRLESQVRALNGQVEQLQYQTKRLEEMLRKFQMDVDARFQDHGGRQPQAPQRRSDSQDQPPSPQDALNQPATNAPPPAVSEGRRRDAFDPSLQNGAAGAPRELGSPNSASKPLRADGRDPTAPMDISPANGRVATPAASPPQAAMAPADPVKADFDAAAELLNAQRYDAAQQAFSSFLQKHPGTRYNAPAIYHFGESYYFQNRHREAAEQFLKIATDYSKSSVAPGAMVKLGVSLNALGAKEQACAFFAEVPHKYPNASASEKQAAAREAKKAAC